MLCYAMSDGAIDIRASGSMRVHSFACALNVSQVHLSADFSSLFVVGIDETANRLKLVLRRSATCWKYRGELAMLAHQVC